MEQIPAAGVSTETVVTLTGGSVRTSLRVKNEGGNSLQGLLIFEVLPPIAPTRFSHEDGRKTPLCF